jgi:hypothetical protein
MAEAELRKRMGFVKALPAGSRRSLAEATSADVNHLEHVMERLDLLSAFTLCRRGRSDPG